MSRFLPSTMGKSGRELLSSARWATQLAWAVSRPLFLGVAGVALVRGIVPAGLALAVRGVVNGAMVSLNAAVPDLWPLLPWVTLGFLCTVLDALTGLANTVLRNRLRDEINCRITADILTHAAALEVAFFEDPRFQDVLQRAKDSPAMHISNFLMAVISASSYAVQILSLLGILVFIEPAVVLVVVLFTLPYLRFQWALAGEHYAVERSRTRNRRWTSYFVSCLTSGSAVGEVKLLRLAPMMVDRFRTLMQEFRDQDRLLYRYGLARSSFFVVLTTAAFYALFIRVAWRVVNGITTVGDLVIFGTVTTRLRLTLETFVMVVSDAVQETLYISNIREFLALQPPAPPPVLASFPPTSRAAIEVRDLRFTYPGAARPALSGISLHIEAGETVALVGENGAGKTTLVKLLAGLYEPDQGCILFDGVDLRDLPRDELHRRIAFVFQGFGCYEAPAADNIAYGDWQRLLSDRDSVRRVARLSGVDELIEALPRGYDTPLGKMFGETDLSAGQWQKVAVARAFARDAALLILDEPTSSMDARAEHALFNQFRSLAKGRTTIIVSHRFSTVRMANRIVVLDNGRLVESGTHAELLARDGNYATLYELHQRSRSPGA
jgi:ABC-type multidrug transport system fused ATPase/permease subunit